MNLWKNKLMLPVAIIIMLVVLYIDKTWIFGPKLNKNKFAKEVTKIAEANQEQVFKVSKIIKYSSAEAIDNSEEQNLKDVSISQYSDVAIYIDNMSDELTEKNTIKELYLDNFKIDVDYNYGTPELYYKNPLEISKFRLIDQNKIEDKLIYDIIYTNKDNQNANYEKPTFFTDCSNPITLGLINKDIIRDYEVVKIVKTVKIIKTAKIVKIVSVSWTDRNSPFTTSTRSLPSTAS